LDALSVLARAANEMSVGEMRQLTSYDALDFTEVRLLPPHRGKDSLADVSGL